MNTNISKVETSFFKTSDFERQKTKIPYIKVSNYPDLGLITSLRFLEWAIENPKGVISLPTGKTPEYFIKWTHYILNNWESDKVESIRSNYGLSSKNKPDLSKLHFIQIDEFYPLEPSQHNSFSNYVKKYYLEGFNISEEKALLISADDIPIYNDQHWNQIFPDGLIDLGLRHADPSTDLQKKQQESIYLIDQWCNQYEEKIRE